MTIETEGLIAPTTASEAREQFDSLEPAAGEVVRAAAKRMNFDSDEYDERVTDDVTEAAREALFASLLEVHVATHTEYEKWCDDHEELERLEVGGENVDNVVWHAAPAAGTVVAATFQREREAAVSTLRRQAFARLYRDVLRDPAGGEAR